MDPVGENKNNFFLSPRLLSPVSAIHTCLSFSRTLAHCLRITCSSGAGDIWSQMKRTCKAATRNHFKTAGEEQDVFNSKQGRQYSQYLACGVWSSKVLGTETGKQLLWAQESILYVSLDPKSSEINRSPYVGFVSRPLSAEASKGWYPLFLSWVVPCCSSSNGTQGARYQNLSYCDLLIHISE